MSEVWQLGALEPTRKFGTSHPVGPAERSASTRPVTTIDDEFG